MMAERWCFLWYHSPLVTEGKGEGEASLTSVSSVTSRVRSKPQAKVSSLEKLASQCPGDWKVLGLTGGAPWWGPPMSPSTRQGSVERERELMGTLTTLQHQDLELRLPSQEHGTELGNKVSVLQMFLISLDSHLLVSCCSCLGAGCTLPKYSPAHMSRVETVGISDKRSPALLPILLAEPAKCLPKT